MISQEFVNRILTKKVHVDYFDEKTAQLVWVEGTFTDYDCNEEENTDNDAIVIETETDLDRIKESTIKKIYLKE